MCCAQDDGLLKRLLSVGAGDGGLGGEEGSGVEEFGGCGIGVLPGFGEVLVFGGGFCGVVGGFAAAGQAVAEIDQLSAQILATNEP